MTTKRLVWMPGTLNNIKSTGNLRIHYNELAVKLYILNTLMRGCTENY